MRLSEILKKYSDFLQLEVKGITANRYLADVRALCIYLQNCEAWEVTDEKVVEYLNTLKVFGLQHNGVVTKSIAIRQFFRFGYIRGWFRFGPDLIPEMRREFKMPYVAPEEDYKKVLKVIPKGKYVHLRNDAMIRLLHDTGARNGEICSLNDTDIDTEKMKALIRTEKSRGMKPFREVFWTKETNDVLKKWMAKKAELQQQNFCENPEALFWGTTNNWYGKRLTQHAVDIVLRKYSQMAKVKTLRPHGLRHAFAHDLANQNANNTIISGLLGHSSLASSQIYTEMRNEEREKAYNRFKRKKKVDKRSGL